MTRIAPELVTLHEPSQACGGTHCWTHDVDEPDEGAYRRCLECGHVYQTAEDLQRQWTANAPRFVTPGAVPPVEQIFFCPICAHDW